MYCIRHIQIVNANDESIKDLIRNKSKIALINLGGMFDISYVTVEQSDDTTVTYIEPGYDWKTQIQNSATSSFIGSRVAAATVQR